MNGTVELIASCGFVPTAEPDPVAVASMWNCNGNTSADPLPLRYGVGEYEFHIPLAVDPQQISITARAYNEIGTAFNVCVNPVATGPENTGFDVVIRLMDGTPTDDAAWVEITISRLPLV